jgi:hypothetical protein
MARTFSTVDCNPFSALSVSNGHALPPTRHFRPLYSIEENST